MLVGRKTAGQEGHHVSSRCSLKLIRLAARNLCQNGGEAQDLAILAACMGPSVTSISDWSRCPPSQDIGIYEVHFWVRFKTEVESPQVPIQRLRQGASNSTNQSSIGCSQMGNNGRTSSSAVPERYF